MSEPTALGRLVGDPRRFLRRHWGARTLLRRAVAGATFHDLLGLDDVDRLISSTLPHYPDINLVQDGMQIDPVEFSHAPDPRRGGARVIDAARVYEYFHAGATIQMQGIHFRHPPLALLCRQLELELTVPVQANLYVTPPQSRGLGLHADSHDVLVLQIAGTKHWKVYRPVAAGTDLHAANTKPRLQFETDLATGDVLYVPTGVPHLVASTTETSAHLTIGFVPPTWGEAVSDLVREVLDALDGDPAFAAVLPAGFASDPARLSAGLSRRLRDVADRIAGLDRHASARAIAQRFWADRSPLLEGQLGQLIALPAIQRDSVLERRAASIGELTQSGGTLTLVLGDRSLEMPSSLRRPMDFILAQRSFVVSALDPFLDEESQLVLVRRLVREGLLVQQPTARRRTATPPLDGERLTY